MIGRRTVYRWRDALTAFERRWDIPYFADLMADGLGLVTDGRGNIPLVHALEQEPIGLLRERVNACGGNANLIVRRIDGAVLLLAIRRGGDLDRFVTIGGLLNDPPGNALVLGVDDGRMRAGRPWTVACCDYPDCRATVTSRMLGEDGMYRSLVDDWWWLLLSDDRDDIRCFCPAHLRHDGDGAPVEYDPDTGSWPVNGELIPFYEKDVSGHPLPLPECEDAILAVLREEND